MMMCAVFNSPARQCSFVSTSEFRYRFANLNLESYAGCLFQVIFLSPAIKGEAQ